MVAEQISIFDVVFGETCKMVGWFVGRRSPEELTLELLGLVQVMMKKVEEVRLG
jgi:hypothetical protein